MSTIIAFKPYLEIEHVVLLSRKVTSYCQFNSMLKKNQTSKTVTASRKEIISLTRDH